MRKSLGLTLARVVGVAACATYGTATAASTIYDFTAKDIDGKTVSMDKYRGKVVMVVNVASK